VAGITITPRRLLNQFDWLQDQSGVPVTDTGWFYAQIYDELLMSRSAAAFQLMKTDPEHPPVDMIQTLGCVELTEAAVEECPCAPPSGCTWWKTDILPPPVGEYHSVTGIGGNLEQLTHYQYRDWTQVKYSLNSRIEAERFRPYYTRRNNRVYVIQRQQVQRIAISSIFYDPVEVQRYRQCAGEAEPCRPFMDYDFYISPELEQIVVSAAAAAITGFRNVAPSDTSNNARPPQGQEPIKQQ
jgi:hypothetical protein